ncbi:MAG: hypothetical protein KC800_05115 [Candidatus Eremiobacteraeota bacterium]|nr:hypothetical protein [Candidatus Eremiobacteraeota bacterium]
MDKLENSPEGAKPVADAMVLARDSKGAVVGMSLTGPDGRFLISEVQGGFVELEGWADPEADAPNVKVGVTAVPGARVTVGEASPVSREQAIEKARPLFSSDDLIACTLNPLPAGTLVEIDGNNLATRRLKSSQWLLFLNRQPLAFFSHPAVLVFVDASTGEVESFEVDTFPTVNSADMYGNLQDLIEITEDGRVQGLPEAVQVPPSLTQGDAVQPQSDLGQDISEQALDPLNDVFLLLISPSYDGAGNFSIDLIVGLAEDKIFTPGVIPPGFLEKVPNSNISKLKWIPGMDTVDGFKSAINLKLERLNKIINERADRGLDSTLIVYLASHCRATAQIKIGSTYTYTADDILNAGLLDSRACKVRFFLECCFAEQTINAMATRIKATRQRTSGLFESDIRLYASSAADKFCVYRGVTNFKVKTFFEGHFTKLVNGNASLVNKPLSGLDIVGLELGSQNDPPSYTLNTKGNPTLINAFTTLKGDPKTVLQGPEVIVIPASAPCPSELVETPGPEPEPPKEEPSKVIFENKTLDFVKVVLKSDNQTINDGNPVTLGPAGTPEARFEQQFIGPVENLNATEFDEPGARVPNLNLKLQIPAGTSRTMQWVNTGGPRTLSTTQQRIAEAAVVGGF